MVSGFKENENLAMCYSDSFIVDKNGTSTGLWSSNKNNFFKTMKWSNYYVNNGLDEVLDFLLYKVTINNVSAVLFKKDFFEKLDFQRLQEFKNAGDLFTYLAMCLRGDISYIPLPLNNYREHLFNFTKKNVANGSIYKERLQCFSFVIDCLKENNLIIREKFRVRKALNFFMHKNVFNLLDFKYKKELKYFIVKCKNNQMINTFEMSTFKLLSIMYSTGIYKIKGLSRKGIKKIFM